MYSTAQKGSSHRMGMVRSPFCVPSQIRKDAAELLRMISSHDCRAQNLLLVFTSDLRSGGTHNAGDSHSGIQGSPSSRFRRATVVGHLEKKDCCRAARP